MTLDPTYIIEMIQVQGMAQVHPQIMREAFPPDQGPLEDLWILFQATVKGEISPDTKLIINTQKKTRTHEQKITDFCQEHSLTHEYNPRENIHTFLKKERLPGATP